MDFLKTVTYLVEADSLEAAQETWDTDGPRFKPRSANEGPGILAIAAESDLGLLEPVFLLRTPAAEEQRVD